LINRLFSHDMILFAQTPKNDPSYNMENLMKSKYFSLVSLIVVAAMLLGACAPAATVEPTQAAEATTVVEPTKATDPTKPVEPTATTAPAPTAEPTKEPVTITYWDQQDSQSAAYDNLIADFQSKNANITVERTRQPYDSYQTIIQAAFEGGNAPDVFMLPPNVAMPELINLGYVRELDDLPGFAEWKASFPDPEFAFAENVNVIKGKTYSAPIAANMPWLWMFVNTGLYKQAGLRVPEDLPATWEQVAANSKVILEKTGRPGFNLGAIDSWFAGWVFWSCNYSGIGFTEGGFGFDLRTGKYVTASEPCYKNLLETLVQMQKDGTLPADALAVNADFVQNTFPTDQGAAHIVTGSWVMGGWTTNNPDFTDYTVVPLPLAGAAEYKGYFYTGPGGSQFAINPNTKHPEEAFEFLKAIYSQDFGKFWADAGLDPNLFTPKPWDQYAKTPAMKAILANADLMIVGPQLKLRNPDVSKVSVTLQGPDLNAIMVGVISGQITDITAALADYDARSQAALEQGIADAVAAGAKVSLADYTIPDWDPAKPYLNK